MRKKKSVTMSYTDEQGVRHYFSGRTKTECREKLRESKEKAREKQIQTTNITVSEWIDECYEVYKKHAVAERTFYNRKKEAVNTVGSVIGSMRLKDVTARDCQIVLNRMSGKSNDYIRKCRQAMDFLFSKAVLEGRIKENPLTNDVVSPKGHTITRRAMTEKEQAVFLRAIKGDPLETYFLFLYYCGCRPSEASEIKESDIIRKTQDGREMRWVHIRGTKSRKADRVVPITDAAWERISPLIADTGKDDYVCRNTRGNKISPTSKAKGFSRICKKMETLGADTTDLVPYCVRHTFITNLYAKNVDIRLTKYLAGHEDISVTANVYTHHSDDFFVEDWEMLNER